MSEPTQTCQVCGGVEIVRLTRGKGFPPELAKRRLAKRCKAAGHDCQPQYRAGMSPVLEAILRAQGDAT